MEPIDPLAYEAERHGLFNRVAAAIVTALGRPSMGDLERDQINAAAWLAVDAVRRPLQPGDERISHSGADVQRDGLEAWERLRAEYGVLAADDLADRAGVSTHERSTYADDLIATGRAFHVVRGAIGLMPAYQFDATGTVYPSVTPVLAALRQAGWSDFSIAIWLASPTTWLSGERPADLLADDGAKERLVNAVRKTLSE